jgi:hypothetical protein
MRTLFPNIRVRIFMPGNKRSIQKTFVAPSGRLWNSACIEAQLAHTAAQIEKNHPNEEYRLVPLGPSRFNFAWVATRQMTA